MYLGRFWFYFGFYLTFALYCIAHRNTETLNSAKRSEYKGFVSSKFRKCRTYIIHVQLNKVGLKYKLLLQHESLIIGQQVVRAKMPCKHENKL